MAAQQTPTTTAALRHLPNAISIARCVAAPVLAGMALAGMEFAFTWLLIAALFSDLVDGWIARSFKLETSLGAKLDSIADVLIIFAALFGLWAFHREVFTNHPFALGLFIASGLLEYAAAFFRYGRLSSFHTYLSKIAGYLLSIYIGVLFVFGHYPWLLYIAIGTSVLGNCEEFILLALLPKWRSDVGGLWQVLRERRGTVFSDPSG